MDRIEVRSAVPIDWIGCDAPVRQRQPARNERASEEVPRGRAAARTMPIINTSPRQEYN